MTETSPAGGEKTTCGCLAGQSKRKDSKMETTLTLLALTILILVIDRRP
jgi:hypothetical protein